MSSTIRIGQTRKIVFQVIIMLLAGLGLRVYTIQTLPLSYDEAIWGNVARNVIDKGLYCRNVVSFPTFMDHPPVHVFHLVLSFLLFGISKLSLRLPTILMNLLLGLFLSIFYKQISLEGGAKGALYTILIILTLPYTITISRHTHVEITMIFYGSLSLILSMIIFRKQNLFYFILLGLTLSLTIFSKLLGIIFLLPVLFIILLPQKEHSRNLKVKIQFIGKIFIFIISFLITTIVIHWKLRSLMPFNTTFFYDHGVFVKLLGVTTKGIDANSPWRNIQLGVFFTQIYKHFFPIAPLSIIAGLVSFYEFSMSIYFRKIKTINSSIIKEQIIFILSILYLLILAAISGATRSMNYALPAIVFLTLMTVSVFYRLIINLLNFSNKKWKNIVRYGINFVLIILIIIGLKMERPWSYNKEKLMFNSLAQIVKQNTNPHNICVFNPYGPEISFLCNRQYNVLYTCSSLSEAKNRLKKARAVVINKENFPNLNEKQMSKFRTFLFKRFRIHRNIGNYELFYNRKGIKEKIRRE